MHEKLFHKHVFDVAMQRKDKGLIFQAPVSKSLLQMTNRYCGHFFHNLPIFT